MFYSVRRLKSHIHMSKLMLRLMKNWFSKYTYWNGKIEESVIVPFNGKIEESVIVPYRIESNGNWVLCMVLLLKRVIMLNQDTLSRARGCKSSGRISSMRLHTVNTNIGPLYGQSFALFYISANKCKHFVTTYNNTKTFFFCNNTNTFFNS